MLTKYDAYKLSEPDEVVITECCQCGVQLFKGQEVLHDQEGDVHFCNETCLTDYVRKHPGEFIELITEHFYRKVDLD